MLGLETLWERARNTFRMRWSGHEKSSVGQNSPRMPLKRAATDISGSLPDEEWRGDIGSRCCEDDSEPIRVKPHMNTGKNSATLLTSPSPLSM